MKSWIIYICLILTSQKASSQSEIITHNFKISQIQIFSGIGFNKVYDWDHSPTELKNDNTNIGFGINLQLCESHNIILSYNYIHKGTLVPNLNQDYVFKYSILSPSYQYEIFQNLIKINGGIYLGYLHEYNLNQIARDFAKDFDFGLNLGPEIEVDMFKNISFYFNPIMELGLIKFSNSKQYSYQLRFGLKYLLENQL